MTPRDLAQRIAALDWSMLPLTQLFAVTAACETLSAVAQEDSNVVPLFPPPLRPEALRNCHYTPARRVMLTRLDGTPFADALCSRTPGSAWDWIVEATCEALGCYPEQVGAVDDTVTVDGLPVFIVAS